MLVINTLDENVELYKEKYAEYFGDVDFSPASALGTDLSITAEMKKIADENLQDAFLQNNPQTATGANLEALCFLGGIHRNNNETDTQLRERLYRSNDSLSIEENLKIALENLKSVAFADVVSNPNLETDAQGIPAKSTAVVVKGGQDQAIGKTIFSFINADKRTFGTQRVTVISDIMNKSYVLSFSRPKPLNVTVRVGLEVTHGYDELNNMHIKQAVLDFFKTEFTLGKEVIHDKLYIPILQNENHFFKGIKRVDITLNNAKHNLLVAYNEYAVLDEKNIEIVV